MLVNRQKNTALLSIVDSSELTLITKQAACGAEQRGLLYCAEAVFHLLITLTSNWIIQKDYKLVFCRLRSRYSVWSICHSP
ncbi:MAG: ABC-type arginine transport system permease subunit [Oceanospirillaceae bacterium]|jgi:ABC-type arginine transport system permease subunit